MFILRLHLVRIFKITLNHLDILFLFSYTSWAQNSSLQHLNNTWIDVMWEVAALVLALTGMVILRMSPGMGAVVRSLGGWVMGG